MEEKKDKLAGQFEQSKGDVKESLGEMRGDEQQEAEGQMDQLKGKFDQGVADLKDKVGDFLDRDDEKKQ